MKKAGFIISLIAVAAIIAALASCSDEPDVPGTVKPEESASASEPASTGTSQTQTYQSETENTESTETTGTGSEETGPADGLPRSGSGYPEGYKPSPVPSEDPYIKTLTFFGDSTTYHLKARGGIAGDKIIHGKAYTVSLKYLSDLRIRTASETDDDYKTVSDYFLTHHPGRLVVTVGLGGGVTYVQSGKLDRDGFMSYYKRMIGYIAEASPETVVMLQSIFPVLETNGIGANNEAIVEVNSWIREFADENGLYYFDTHSVLTDENGALKSEYAVKKDSSGKADGYHITAAGYEAILNYIIAYKYEG